MFHSNDGGFIVDCPNGWTVSVQWGAGNYGDNRSANLTTHSRGWESRTAEVASWRTNARDTEKWYDGDDSTGVRGWQTVDEVMVYMRMISDLEDKPQPKVDRAFVMEST